MKTERVLIGENAFCKMQRLFSALFCSHLQDITEKSMVHHRIAKYR